MGFSLNTPVKPQTTELNKKAKISGTEKSPTKRLYVEGGKRDISRSDALYLIKNIRHVYRFPYSLYNTVKLIRSDTCDGSHMSQEVYVEFGALLESLKVGDYGFFEVTPAKVFKDCGVPHKYALVFSCGMDDAAFKAAPSMECQVEVAKVYCETGHIANMVSDFLQGKGFGASPNHSMGGQLDYSMAAEWAGIAITGRHSMAITKKHGPCHRICVVYTSIENLGEYIKRNSDDMVWIREFCKKCGKCLRMCPTGAIMEVPTVLDGSNPTRIDYDKCCQGFVNFGCGICIRECPFTSGNYNKIKEPFFRARN